MKCCRWQLANRTQQIALRVKGPKWPSNIWRPSGISDRTHTLPCYINNIGTNISSKLCLFADDTILYRSIRNNTDTHKLQEDLTKVQFPEQCWQMEFNVTKCNVLSVTNKKKPTPTTYQLPSPWSSAWGSWKYQVPGCRVDKEAYLGKTCH